MAKTVKELSNDLKVSKQAINRLLTSDLRRQYVTTKGISEGKAFFNQ